MDNLLLQIEEKAKIWMSDDFDSETRSKVQKLVKNENKDELIDSFYRTLEFGTGGLRGIMGVGINRMNIYTVGMATQGFANCLKREFGDLSQISVVVGHDVRNNSRLFAETTANIFSANGMKVYLFEDFRPTPEISFAIRHFGAQGGVNVTASHNPKEYNGYKAYWDDGAQIMPPHDENIVKEVTNVKISEIKFTPIKENIVIIGKEIDELYQNEIVKLSISPDVIKENSDIKIVYTPIHGVGVTMIPETLRKYGFKNIFNVPEQDITSGDFPTVKSPNPEEPAAMKMALDKGREVDADVVLASDPDADRIAVATKDLSGNLVLLNGNQTAAIITYYLAKKLNLDKKLKGNEFMVKTIVTSDLLKNIIQNNNIEFVECYTGFKYIAEEIKIRENKKVYIGGGEESFGYLIGDFVRDKDAVSACCIIAEMVAWAKSKNMTLYGLLIDIYLENGFYKESNFNLVKKGKEGADIISKMMKDYRNNPAATIDNSKVVNILDYTTLTNKYLPDSSQENIDLKYTSNVLQYITEDGTKLSIRPSGTEPKIKYYVSVKTKLNSREDFETINKQLDDKIQRIKSQLGF